jgi:phospholipid transport system transporter-binding protein
VSPAQSHLSSLSRRDDGTYVIRGELSFTTVSPLLKHSGELFEGGRNPITVDLDGVTRADSAGLSLLIEWWRKARSQGLDIQYVNLPEQMLAMAKLGGLDELLPVK